MMLKMKIFEEVTEKVDEVKSIEFINMDVNKVFDKVPHGGTLWKTWHSGRADCLDTDNQLLQFSVTTF